MQGRSSEDRSRRLGLHRPGVTVIFSYVDVLQVYCQNNYIRFINLFCVNFVLVTCLPRDRLSQLTRRGMLTVTKTHAKWNATRQREGQHVSYQRKAELSETFSGGPAVKRGIPREQTRAEESEKVNL